VYAPSTDDEIATIIGYLDQQLDALRAAVIGLTDDQARLRPCRSALSVGGLIKHATHGMRGAIERLGRGEDIAPPGLDQAAFAAYQASFELGPDEATADTVDEFDTTRAAYLAAVAATDPNSPIVEPPAPWHGIFDARPASARYYLVHQIEEFARHAGHADILREQIDGMAVPAIVLSRSGTPGNDFFQPYAPPSGTIGGPRST